MKLFFDAIPQKKHHFPFGNTPKMALYCVLSTEEHIYSFFFSTSLTELIVFSSFLLLKHAQQIGGFSSAPWNLKYPFHRGIFRVVRWKSNISRHIKSFQANFYICYLKELPPQITFTFRKVHLQTFAIKIKKSISNCRHDVVAMAAAINGSLWTAFKGPLR